MSDHVSERGATCGATKMHRTVHGCVCERARGCFFFLCFKRKLPQSGGYQWLLMNACCNLNTEQRASESLRSHSNTISTFFDSDAANPGSTLQTSAAEYSVSSRVQA